MSINSTEKTDNSPEQQTSRPSSAGSNHEGEHLHFDRQLSTLNDEENKQSSNFHPIIWDDPYELLVTNEQTGRIGISAETFPSNSTSRCMKPTNFMKDFQSACFSVENINPTHASSLTQTNR